MKKFTKIILLSIATLFIGLILYLNYQTYFSEAAKKGKMNIENIKAVKEEMSVKEVLLIMGEPDMIDYCDLDSVFKGYNYRTNDDSYVHVTVCFDSTMKVEQTYYPKH